MRIGIDCRLSGPKHAGIGRYIHNLIIKLPALLPDVTWVYFVNDSSQAVGLDFPNLEVITVPIRHYSLAEQLKLPGIFAGAKLDLLHVPHFNVPLFYQGKVCVTIHDLLWHEYRGTHVTTLSPFVYWLKYLAYRVVASQAIKKAQAIIVPAKTIKRTLQRYYPGLKPKIFVTKEGIAAEFQKPDKAGLSIKLALPPNRKILLYVGSLYPHKNINLVLSALAELPEYHLVLVGARNIFQDQIKTAAHQTGVESQVIMAGYLSDEELRHLMSQAWALIQPSLSEGFGLTGVEAMAAGLPVVASQIPIFQEIYGQAAIFFDPTSQASLVTALTSLDAHHREHLIKAGTHQAQLYSWGTMAQETLQVYQTILVHS